MKTGPGRCANGVVGSGRAVFDLVKDKVAVVLPLCEAVVVRAVLARRPAIP